MKQFVVFIHSSLVKWTMLNDIMEALRCTTTGAQKHLENHPVIELSTVACELAVIQLTNIYGQTPVYLYV